MQLSHICSWTIGLSKIKLLEVNESRSDDVYTLSDCLYYFTKDIMYVLNRRNLCGETNLSPPVKYLLTIPMRYFFCGSFMFFFLSCVYYDFVCVCLFMPCGHLHGKG